MGKPKKSQKKFSRKHLKSAIEKRRKLKPLKDSIRRKEAALEEKRQRASENGATAKKKVEDLNVDELMAGDFLDDEDDFGEEPEFSDDEDMENADALPEVDEEEDFVDITPEDDDDEQSDDDDDENTEMRDENKKFKSEIEKHKKQLENLKKKDPEFYQYLKEHDKELLVFKDDEDDDDKIHEEDEGKQEAQKQSILTSTLLETWCSALRENQSLAALRKLLGAYRSACHYGEGEDEEVHESFAITSSQVFNKVMVFGLSELDEVFRRMLHVPGEKKLVVQELKKLTRWKKLFPFIKSYLASSLHVLNQMTDNRMISFTLRRLRPSIVFMGEFSALARRYMKAILHFWGTGEETVSFIAFSLIRDMALQFGSECLESALKLIYKQFVSNAKFINASSLPRVQFLANCVAELYSIDAGLSYQMAFSFIRQMAIILRNAITVKSKDAYKKVYCWQYLASLELWVKVVRLKAGKDSLQPLAYPLAQIITGVARLVPTARYFPLRMQCGVMLNRLAAATNTFVPVASVLLDMLEFKEMRKPPTGGAGFGLDFQLILKVPKPTMKTRGFHEECVSTILEQLAEHLSQWSCSVAFPELALLPLVQLRRFIKDTNVDRFRRQTRQLVEQIEKNIEFVKKKRESVQFSPKDTDAVAAFLKEEREAGTSPLAVYCASLKQRAKDRKQALVKSSVEVREPGSKPAEGDEGVATQVFNKKWHEEKKKAGSTLVEAKQKENEQEEKANANDEDVVEDLLLSSDDDDDDGDDVEDEEAAGANSSDDDDDEQVPAKRKNNKKRKNKQQSRSSKLAPKGRSNAQSTSSKKTPKKSKKKLRTR